MQFTDHFNIAFFHFVGFIPYKPMCHGYPIPQSHFHYICVDWTRFPPSLFRMRRIISFPFYFHPSDFCLIPDAEYSSSWTIPCIISVDCFVMNTSFLLTSCNEQAFTYYLNVCYLTFNFWTCNFFFFFTL